jgi:diguanylate cyclase (GGDEF)-like protein
VKVLIADDDAATRQLLKRVLREAGCQVLLAADGLQAWETYRTGGVSLVITDWEMPGLSGIELCSRIRRHDQVGYTYIIFITTRSGHDHMIEGLSAGADDFISKPVHPEELRVRLRVAQRILSLEAHLRQANHDLVRMNERLLKMSRLDPLMEIGNRMAFEEKFDEYHRHALQEGQRYAVVMCDVDNFKLCNDNFGHQLGDDVLRQVAAAIRERLRAGDAAFRYGGEEILMLLGHQDLAGAVAAADRIRASIASLEFAAYDGKLRRRLQPGRSVATVRQARTRRTRRPRPLSGQTPGPQSRGRNMERWARSAVRNGAGNSWPRCVGSPTPAFQTEPRQSRLRYGDPASLAARRQALMRRGSHPAARAWPASL